MAHMQQEHGHDHECKQAIFQLSAYETDAESFFDTLRKQHADVVVDVRLHNSNQLCGFTKRKDLEFFVPQLTGAVYVHDLDFAPTPDLLESYTKKSIGWDEYARRYRALMLDKDAPTLFEDRYGAYAHICLLGTSTRKRRSHTEVLNELLQG